MSNDLSRRTLFKAGIAGAAAAVPAPVLAEGKAASAGNSPAAERASGDVLTFFSDAEARFMAAAVNRLVPPDDKWPGAAEAGVVTYIDRQLGSAYGAGARMYLKGPWEPDAPTQQGYQLRFSPAELYRVALAEILPLARDRHGGREFWNLDDTEMDSFLSGLESGDIALTSMPSPVFFETLLANTMEGWFADPVYGGNRDMAAWKMIGFPGAFAEYVDVVEQHGQAFERPPISIADAKPHGMPMAKPSAHG